MSEERSFPCGATRLGPRAGTTTPPHSITIDQEHAGRRLDKFLRSRLKGVPAGTLFQQLRRGKLRVNGRKSQENYRLQLGDRITIPALQVPDPGAPARRLPAALLAQLDDVVLYEDSELLVIDKPAGMAVHRGTDVDVGVIEALRHLRPDLPELELSHRLDRETSGVLVLAKTASMLRYLHELLRDREDEIERHYLAIVAGRWSPGVSVLDAPLERRDARVVVSASGQRAETRAWVRRRISHRATLVSVQLLTGRKHQIRVHLQHAGHPIAGDDRYGDREFNRRIARAGGAGLHLHASEVVIPLPHGPALTVTAPLPVRWERLLQAGV